MDDEAISLYLGSYASMVGAHCWNILNQRDLDDTLGELLLPQKHIPKSVFVDFGRNVGRLGEGIEDYDNENSRDNILAWNGRSEDYSSNINSLLSRKLVWSC